MRFVRSPRAAAGLIATALMLLLAAPAQAVNEFDKAMAGSLTATAASSRYLGPALSGLVVDPDDGSVLWRYNSSRTRMPASSLKLLTAYTVLHSMDTGTTLATTACRNDQAPSAIYVRGGGDPSLSVARLQSLANEVADALESDGEVKASLYLDASLFPAPGAATGWLADYLRSDVQYVRGLTLAGYRGADGRVAVGRVLVAAFKAQGIAATVAGNAGTPSGCQEVAATESAPVGRLVADMLSGSNNDYAEFLLRHAALRRGYAPSWRGALDNELGLLRRAGVPTSGLRVYDGSGLSRSSRMPVATLAAVLRLLRDDADQAAIVFAWGALPTAGETGTLARRFARPDQACARGHVRAKTGSLADANALAGIAEGVDGRDRLFVFLDSGPRTSGPVGSALDTLATTVVGCQGQ